MHNKFQINMWQNEVIYLKLSFFHGNAKYFGGGGRDSNQLF
jgi:hypothetical protein